VGVDANQQVVRPVNLGAATSGATGGNAGLACERQLNSSLFARQGWLAYALATLAIAYRATLLTGIGTGDTAKFQYIGRVLGTPHSTGHPLFILLNAVFVRLAPVALLTTLLAVAASQYVYFFVDTHQHMRGDGHEEVETYRGLVPGR
jgi:hypothetical protein